MSDDDMKDTALVSMLRAAGIEDERIRARVVFTKNEMWEAAGRDKVVAALSKRCTLVSYEHDGTPVLDRGVDVVKACKAVGVDVCLKPYRSAEELISALKVASEGVIPAHEWDEKQPDWEAELVTARECVAYLSSTKRPDRDCPLTFARHLSNIRLMTTAGLLPIKEILVTVPASATALKVFRWTWRWESQPLSVQQAEIIALCPSIIIELLKHDYKQQLEMKGMFRSAVDTLFTGALYNTGIIEKINSAHDLILFSGGMAWHRDLRVLMQTGPSDHLSLSVGYAFPAAEITEIKRRLEAGGVDLKALFMSLKAREGLPNWEILPPDARAQLNIVKTVIKALHDIHELYEPNWPLTLHVLKFLTCVLFSRETEEHGVPLGCGNNGKSWLMFVLERLLGEYSCCVQAGLYSKPVPSSKDCNMDWLALMGRKVFLGGERSGAIKVDGGTWKALRDPTNAVTLRGLYENNVKFRSGGRLILPDNNKIEFTGGVDGGIERSMCAWPHPWVFTTTPTLPHEKPARPIKTIAYVDSIIPGLFYLLSVMDEVWSADWTSGIIKPRPAVVIAAVQEMCEKEHASNFSDFVSDYCELVTEFSEGTTPAKVLKLLREVDPVLAKLKDLETVALQFWQFVNYRNLRRVKANRHGVATFLKIR
jgi:hypothetical protein